MIIISGDHGILLYGGRTVSRSEKLGHYIIFPCWHLMIIYYFVFGFCCSSDDWNSNKSFPYLHVTKLRSWITVVYLRKGDEFSCERRITMKSLDRTVSSLNHFFSKFLVCDIIRISHTLRIIDTNINIEALFRLVMLYTVSNSISYTLYY